ncbi:MAG: hypothetical protein ACXWQR_21705 [Ktedonobacterales bacterium]
MACRRDASILSTSPVASNTRREYLAQPYQHAAPIAAALGDPPTPHAEWPRVTTGWMAEQPRLRWRRLAVLDASRRRGILRSATPMLYKQALSFE